MAPSGTTVVLLVAILLCLFGSGSSGELDFIPSECLRVPATEFVGSVKSTLDAVKDVASAVAKFANVVGDFRLATAVSDCLDLLDLSADELSWTLDAFQNPNIGKKNNCTRNLSGDLRTWLSAALINQDTCMEGLDGTNGLVKKLVAGGLKHVTSLIGDILGKVRPVPDSKTKPKSPVRGVGHRPGSGRKLFSHNNIDDHQLKFPGWLKPKSRKLLQSGGVAVDAVVALDGSGSYNSIKDAVSAAPEFSSKRFVIYVKKGVYREYVEISKKKWNIMMIGDGMDVTVISGNRSFFDGWTPFSSATFAVNGRGFIARDMTFENTAGPQNHQAVAFRSRSDLSVIYRCAIRGYQDTLYVYTMRQFYRDCIITGTIDIIFGDATVVFQNCEIQARKGLLGQMNTITAQGRKSPTEPTGFSIQFCNITGEADLIVAGNSITTYLGRPWQLYSRTVIMQSFLSDAIMPQGWLEWNGNFALNTLYYGEYMNYGPGAGLGNRVNWPGYHVINDSAQANDFTVAQFFLGKSWLPLTGVKYTADLGTV